MRTINFDQLEAAFEASSMDEALSRVASQLNAEGLYHELFDVRLMQNRCRLGLPVVLSDGLDSLPEPVRSRLEDSYLDACREVSGLLLENGRFREAWTYIKPLGESQSLKQKINETPATEENLEELIEVALHEGIAPARGFQLVLEHYGTCNAITTIESRMYGFPLADRQAAVELLVRHLHQELLENVRADIKNREGDYPASASLSDLVKESPELLSDKNYHVDTTHLNSTVRLARIAEDNCTLRLATDLTEYGRRLDRQYQFPGEPPFEDVFPSHSLFFNAQLGREVDEAISFFRQQAKQADPAAQGTACVEVLVLLFSRLDRCQEAIDELLQGIPPGVRPSGIAPTLWDLCRRAGTYTPLIEASQRRGEVLGFIAGLAQSRLEESTDS